MRQAESLGAYFVLRREGGRDKGGKKNRLGDLGKGQEIGVSVVGIIRTMNLLN